MTSARPSPPVVAILSERNLFREGVVELLKKIHPAHPVEVTTLAALVRLMRRQQVALVLVDLDHERDDPRQILRELRALSPHTSVVMVGTRLQNAALARSADGWLELPEADAIRLGRMAIAASRPHRGRLRFRPSAALARAGEVWRTLTRRQQQVMELLSNGADNLKIAAALDLSERAVKVHVSALLRRFGADSRAELAVLGARAGLRGVVLEFEQPARPARAA
jgi:two-component system, NarL family, nitrate/nitrite response regulator NarL